MLYANLNEIFIHYFYYSEKATLLQEKIEMFFTSDVEIERCFLCTCHNSTVSAVLARPKTRSVKKIKNSRQTDPQSGKHTKVGIANAVFVIDVTTVEDAARVVGIVVAGRTEQPVSIAIVVILIQISAHSTAVITGLHLP